MRYISIFAAAGLLAGCVKTEEHEIPSRSACEQSSHALRIHDATIESVRQGYPAQFTVRLPSKGHAPYRCKLDGNQVQCVSASAVTATEVNDARVAELLREREAIHARALNACRV